MIREVENLDSELNEFGIVAFRKILESREIDVVVTGTRDAVPPRVAVSSGGQTAGSLRDVGRYGGTSRRSVDPGGRIWMVQFGVPDDHRTIVAIAGQTD